MKKYYDINKLKDMIFHHFVLLQSRRKNGIIITQKKKEERREEIRNGKSKQHKNKNYSAK